MCDWDLPWCLPWKEPAEASFAGARRWVGSALAAIVLGIRWKRAEDETESQDTGRSAGGKRQRREREETWLLFPI